MASRAYNGDGDGDGDCDVLYLYSHTTFEKKVSFNCDESCWTLILNSHESLQDSGYNVFMYCDEGLWTLESGGRALHALLAALRCAGRITEVMVMVMVMAVISCKVGLQHEL